MFATHRRRIALLSLDRFMLARVAGCLGAGLGLGVLTNLAQGWLPGSWNQIANSGAAWSARSPSSLARRLSGHAVLIPNRTGNRNSPRETG